MKQTIKVLQTKFGKQDKPYGDHVWEWKIASEKDAEYVLNYCKIWLNNVDSIKTTLGKSEYKKAIGYGSDKTFDEIMSIKQAGYYEFAEIAKGKFVYRIVKEYID